MQSKGRKSTQRERLLRGMVDVANRGGYAAANVSAVIEKAGVSRPTFYDYFADRDDCFLASVTDVRRSLLEHVTAKLADARPQEAAAKAVEAVAAFASAEPAPARFLMAESMAGGPLALDARDAVVAEIARAIDEAQRTGPASTPAPDLEYTAVVGGVFRMLATRLRRGEPAISKVTDELLGWLAYYERPSGKHRWRTANPAPAAAPSPFVPDVPIQQMPGVLPPGRPRISEEEVAENHRLRILYAAARISQTKGYTATTVADITKLARVDGHVFYRQFTDKQDAFMAVHALGLQQVMDVTSTAFFAGDSWPERCWEAGRALTQLLQDNPLVAQIGFVEAYAVGSAAVQRIEESYISFTFFLQEGLVYRPQRTPPSRVVTEVIVTSVFEIMYQQARNARGGKVVPMLPYIAHLWLTPFLGIAEADAFISRKSRSSRKAPSASPRKRKPTGNK
jgi:AcrR family transcriptional regulator